MSKIRVLVADDHAIVREGLRAVIAAEDDMELVGEAADGIEAVELAHEIQPDVILMDLLMPGKDGIEAISEILQENPDARVLVLTSFTEVDKILPTVKSGALGYIVKNSNPDELISAIRDVSQGAVSMQPDIARQLFNGLKRTAESQVQESELLSERELEVLKLLARGLTNEEIGEKLFISHRTVGVHISHILGKLELNNRTQAALYALRAGLTSLFNNKNGVY